ncbi:hypothetical protein PLIIFM63780_006174 [Purpureocillium lilacinum]|nr:hypothetical protein PLIIFM63780_006174 [Purpureocillium lilacinum]
MAMTQETIAKQLAETVAKHEEELWRVNQEIHSHPELAFEETHAHDTVCGMLEALGYNVTRHAHNLKTAFEVEAGSGGGVIVYNAEYDALPGIGHACGHNLIATSSIAAFLATAEALKANSISGRVRLLGTPGEEEGGGKVALLDAGAYQGVDACLMGHPGPRLAPVDGVIHVPFLAVAGVTVTFNGVNAHAGNVSYEVPSIHPIFLLDVEDPSIGPHHPKFAETAGTKPSFTIALDFAKVMAATGLDILQNSSFREELNSELATAQKDRS